MQWQTKIIDPITWHKTFTWMPICREEDSTGIKRWVWLESIYRRLKKDRDIGGENCWEYAIDDFDILKYTERDVRRAQVGTSTPRKNKSQSLATGNKQPGVTTHKNTVIS